MTLLRTGAFSCSLCVLVKAVMKLIFYQKISRTVEPEGQRETAYTSPRVEGPTKTSECNHIKSGNQETILNQFRDSYFEIA